MDLCNAGRRVSILGIRGIPARYGGFETFAEELSVRLVQQGIEVTVYCEADHKIHPMKYKGIKLVSLPTTECGPLSTVLFDLRCLWHARKGHDVVYMLGYGAAPFCFIPRLWGSKVWLNVDGIEWARAKWGKLAKAYFKLMEFFSMRAPNRVIADAEGIKIHLDSRHNRVPSCSVIPYGAPVLDEAPAPSLLDEWELSPQGYFLVVARIEPENHVREIIEGYKASVCSLPLIVVGNHKEDTSYTKGLLPLADDNVRFIGGVYDKEKLQALRCHSLAYFHGHSVGGTNPSLLEALGCGNLIIAHDNVFNREVTDGIGFYFKTPADIPVLIERVETLSESERDELACKARGRIREKYDWDVIADHYIELIEADMKVVERD